MFEGYRMRARAPQVQLAERALRACGYEPEHDRHRRRLGRQRVPERRFGLRVPGQRDRARPPSPSERVSVGALEGMFEVAIALIDEAGHVPDGERA